MITKKETIFKRSYKMFKIIEAMIQRRKIAYTYNADFSKICGEDVWKQKYAPCLKEMKIIVPINRRRGMYSFNQSNFYYNLYNFIVDDEKKLVIKLLEKYKKKILKNYAIYFKGASEIDLRLKKLKIKSDRDARRLDYIAGRCLNFSMGFKKETLDIFSLFAWQDLFYEQNLDETPKNFRFAVDFLIDRVNSFYKIDWINKDIERYLSVPIKEMNDYKQVKKEIISFWLKESKSHSVPSLIMLPVIKEQLECKMMTSPGFEPGL